MTSKKKRRAPRKLTDKQVSFCTWYVSAAVNLNATEAARRAGYAGTENTLGTVGFQNMQKPAIRAEIDKRMARAMSGADVTVENILRVVQVIGEKALEAGKYAPAARCAELLGKYLSMWTDKIEHVIDYEDMSTEDLVRLLAQVAEAGGVDLGKLLAEYGSGDSLLLDPPANTTKH